MRVCVCVCVCVQSMQAIGHTTVNLADVCVYVCMGVCMCVCVCTCVFFCVHSGLPEDPQMQTF